MQREVTSIRWGGCIVSRQAVATPEGDVAVEELYPGTPVLCYDPSSGRTVTTEVQSHQETVAKEYLLLNGELAVTGVHEIYSDDRGWIPASVIRLGERLRTLNGLRTVDTAQLVKKRTAVFAIEVKTYSCFFASGYLVHNKALSTPPDTTLQPRSRARRKSQLQKNTRAARG